MNPNVECAPDPPPTPVAVAIATAGAGDAALAAPTSPPTAVTPMSSANLSTARQTVIAMNQMGPRRLKLKEAVPGLEQGSNGVIERELAARGTVEAHLKPAVYESDARPLNSVVDEIGDRLIGVRFKVACFATKLDSARDADASDDAFMLPACSRSRS